MLSNFMRKARGFIGKRKTIVVGAVLATIIALLITSKTARSVSVVADGNTYNITTYKSNVQDALNRAGFELGEKDKIFPSLDSSISDGMEITIRRAVPITVYVDGEILALDTAELTVEEMLIAEEISLGGLDKVNLQLTDSIQSGISVRITRVDEKYTITTEAVMYGLLKKDDSNLEQGMTKILQEGVEGEMEVTTKVVYEDGIEVSREVVDEMVTKEPVDEVVAVGSLKYFKASRGGTGTKVYYTKVLRMKATSYTSCYACTGKNPGDPGFGITATGTKARRDPNGYSTVAVDPDVIPLGTKLYIEGYGYAIAEDVGGAVNGNIIDLYFEPHEMGKGLWSTHYTNVYILK